MANLQAIAADGLTVIYLLAEGTGTDLDPYVSKFKLVDQNLLATEETLTALKDKLPQLVLDGDRLLTSIDPSVTYSTELNEATLTAIADAIPEFAFDGDRLTVETGLDQPLTLAELQELTVKVQEQVPVDVSELAKEQSLINFANFFAWDGDKLKIKTELNQPLTSTELQALIVKTEIQSNASLSNDWTTLRTFNAIVTPVSFNIVPTNPTATNPNVTNNNADFVTLTGFGLNSANEIVLLVKLRTLPAAACRVYLWIYDGVETYCVSSFSIFPGENGLSTLDSNGAYNGTYPVMVTLKRFTSNLKIQARITLDTANVIFDNTGACLNPGLKGGELVNLSTSSALPRGLSGEVTAIDTSTDTVTYSGLTLSNDEYCRLNLASLNATVIPALGFSSGFNCSDANTNIGTITLDGRNPAVTYAVGDNVRFRAAPGSTLPSLAGTAIAATTTYIVIAASGSPGTQTLRLSVDGVSPLNITSQGVGRGFIYKHPSIFLYVKGGNQFSYTQGGAAIDFRATHQAISVTCTAGTASTITQAAHGYSAGQELIMGGTTAPAGGILGNKYYVLATGLAAGSYQVGHTPGGPPIAFTSAGTAVTFNGIAVTVSAGTASLITFSNNHFLSALQYFTLGSTTTPTNYPSAGLYVIATGTTNVAIACSDLAGGAAIALGSTGTNVTLTANISGVGTLPLEKTSAYIASNPTETRIAFANTIGGEPITMTGGAGVHSFTPVTPPAILPESYIKARSL